MIRPFTKTTTRVLLWLALLSTSYLLHAHTDEHPSRHWEIASAEPDRIFLSFCGDPATTRTVTWRTHTGVTNAYAEIAKALAEPRFDKPAKRLSATTERVDLNQAANNRQGEVHYHSVVFKDLEPETLYAYRVGDGKNRWSEWIQFRTASKEPKPFSFVYFGDAQNHVLSHWSRTIRMAYQTAPDAHFALHAGDLINTAHADVEWAEWFKAGGFLHSQWTGLPIAGNHEYSRTALAEKQADQTLSLLWRPQFTLPVEPSLPEELHETVYTVDYQGTQIIALNSNRNIEEQTAYLEQQLKKPGYRWRIVSFHHPLFSPGGMRDNADLRHAWKPLFDRYGVDLVLQGHDHTYARGQVPVRTNSGDETEAFQTLYVTSVSGRKQYEIMDGKLENYASEGFYPIRIGENTQFFQVIDVHENSISYKAYTATGDLYDAATITKNFATGEKTITQQIPDVAERTYENTAPYEPPTR